MPPPEIPTCTLHYTQTPHQNISKPGILTPWTIYLQASTHWYTINFHEQAILEARLSSHSHSHSKGSRRDLYDFPLREWDTEPDTYERRPESDNGELRTKRMKEFGVVRESVGMRRLLSEFGERVRRGEIPVDELFLPPLFLLWLESLNLKAPKTKKPKSKSKESNPKSQAQTANLKPQNPPETSLSSNPNFKILLQVSKPQPSNSQESWIWNETRTLLKLTSHAGSNKSGLYLIPNPNPSSSLSSSENFILFSWTHGSLTTKDNILHARGKCLTFSPPPQHSSIPPPPVHLHPLKNSPTPSPHFAASINRSHFSKKWEAYEVDINQPAIPCVWWEENVTIMEDGVLLREYEDLYERSKEKGGPQFTPSTFLAQIFHTINTSIPPSKKRGSKHNPPNDNDNDNNDPLSSIDISSLYERGRHDLARANRHTYCLKALALSSFSSSRSSSRPPRSHSLPTKTKTKTKTKPRSHHEIPRASSPSQRRRTSHENYDLRSRSQSWGPSQSQSRSRSTTTKSTHELNKKTPSHSHSSSPFPSLSLNPNYHIHKPHPPHTHTHTHTNSVPPPPPPSRSSTFTTTTTPKQRQNSRERSESKSKSKSKSTPTSTSTSESKHPRDPRDALRKTRDLFGEIFGSV